MAAVITQAFVDQRLPIRARDAHKGHFGRVLVLAGSTGFSGAALLCASAAARTGAGLVTLAVPQSVWLPCAVGLPEAMCHPLPCDENGRLTRAAFPFILEQARKADALVCGPGLGQSADITALVPLLLDNDTPLVLDADGINSLSAHILNCSELRRRAPLVLTPHEGEFRRLGGDLSAGRETAALALARRLDCVLLLKGRHTLVATAEGALLENSTGNPGMATGGSGDVLAGVIGALLAQGLTPADAAACGAFLHGQAGDRCADALGEYGLLASDIVAALPQTLRHIKP